MDFSLDDTQRQLLDGVDRLLERRYGFRDRAAALASQAGWSRDVWNELAAMGLTALPFDEADGGHGGNAVDVMLLMQAFGRALLLEPYLPSIVMAGRALSRAALGAQRDAVLAPVANGERIAAWAHAEPAMRTGACIEAALGTRATRDRAGWRITGRKSHVLHGASADVLVVSALVDPAEAPSLFLVDPRAPGVEVHAQRRIDGVALAQIALRDAPVPAEGALQGAADVASLIEEVEDAACAAAVAEAVGAMESALRLTLEHIRTRRQFGVAIGSFQALQHRAADMHVAIEQARSMAMYAAMAADAPDARRRSAGVSAAKIVADRAARLVGDSAIQLHGGMGMTDEHPIGHYARKLAALRASFGDIDFHARRLASLQGALEEAT